MSYFQQIKDAIKHSKESEVFLTFDELFREFPGGRPDHFRPIHPVDLDRVHKEAEVAGLEPFSKNLNEGGVWFRIRSKQ